MQKSPGTQESLVKELLEQFVDMLIATHGATSKPVVEAFRAVPRHLFVDQYYRIGKARRLSRVAPQHPTAAQLKTIYSDLALASHQRYGQGTSSTSQPSLVAHMLEELQISPGMQILEIGAGTGWNAALMGALVGSKGHVYSIDIQGDVAQRARQHLRRQGCRNVTIIHSDAGEGHSDNAPYDRIITTVACPDITPHWATQLRDGGALLITLQDIPGQPSCLLTRLWKHADHLRGEVVGLPYFMTLQGPYGTALLSPRQGDERLQRLKAGRKPHRMSMAWQCWHATMGQWLTHNLLFFAYLEGMSIEPIGQHLLIRWGQDDGFCIPTEEHLEVYGSDDGYHKLREVIRKWLTLGAPRRDAYQLEVWPRETAKRTPKHGWLVLREHCQLIFRLKK